MKILSRFFCLYISLLSYTDCHQNNIIFQTQKLDNHTLQLFVTFKLQDKEVLYKDSLDFSLDSPSRSLSPWASNREAVSWYDEISKETKLVFDTHVTISLCSSALQLNANDDDEVFLCVTYQTNNLEFPRQAVFQLPQKKVPAPQTQEYKKTPIQKKQQVYSIKKQPPRTSWLTKLVALPLVFFQLNTNFSSQTDWLLILFFVMIIIYSLYRSQSIKHDRLKIFIQTTGLLLVCLIISWTSYKIFMLLCIDHLFSF